MDYTILLDKLENESDFDKIKIIKEKLKITDVNKFYKSYYEKYSFNVILSIIVNYELDGFEFLKSKGVFRLFDNLDESNIIIGYIDRLLSLKNEIALDYDYLITKLSFKKIIELINKKIYEYLNNILKFKESAISDILTFCSIQFFKNPIKYGGVIKNKNYDSRREMNYIDYCNAASIIFDYLCKYQDKFTSNKDRLYLFFDIDKCLIFFNKLSKLKEYEATYDYLKMSVKKEKNDYYFFPIDNTMWKSIDYSYIVSNFAKMNSIIYTNDFNGDSLYDVFEKDVENILDNVIKCELKDDYGYKRYIYKISLAGTKIFASNGLLSDENSLQDALSRELVMPQLNLYNLKINDNLLLFDIIKFKRYFNFMAEKIRRLEFESNDVLFNSICQCISINDFKHIFKQVLNDDLKINDILKLFNFNDKESIKDILYCPLLMLGDDIYFSPIIATNSYMERNSITIAKSRSVLESDFRVINNRDEFVEIALKRHVMIVIFCVK